MTERAAVELRLKPNRGRLDVAGRSNLQRTGAEGPTTAAMASEMDTIHESPGTSIAATNTVRFGPAFQQKRESRR